jgi:fucose 4-O-acetylase-like acetyltransferase
VIKHAVHALIDGDVDRERGQPNSKKGLPSTPRSLFIDVARGFAILLVVFGHSLEAVMNRPGVGDSLFIIWKGIYSFHVPLFFVLAGLVSKPRSFAEELKRSLGLMMTALLAEIPSFWIEQLLGRDTHLSDHLRNLAGLYHPSNYHQGLIVTWFLSSLALVQILDHGIRQSFRPLKLTCLILLLGSFITHQITQINLLQIGSLFPGWICFTLGRSLRSFRLPPPDSMTRIYHPLLGLSALTFALGVDRLNRGCLFSPLMDCPNIGHQFAVFLITGDIGFPALFLLSAFAGSLAVLHLSALMALRWQALPQAIGRIGQKSLLLLLANGYFLSLFELPILKPLKALDPITPVGGLILSILIVLLHIGTIPLLTPVLKGLVTIAQRCSSHFVDWFILDKIKFIPVGSPPPD